MTNWPQHSQTLNQHEKIELKTRYCKGCGKPLSLLEGVKGRKLYHERCLPGRVKTPNWRR